MPMALATWSTGSFINRAQAAAAQMPPTMPVVCQPPPLLSRGLERWMRAEISLATMTAASSWAGVAPFVSATASSAGITGATDWPLMNEWS